MNKTATTLMLAVCLAACTRPYANFAIETTPAAGSSAVGAHDSTLMKPGATAAEIGAVIRTLKARGFTILLVEQNFHFAATVADRHYVVEHGRVIDMIANEAIEANRQKLEGYLGV